MAFDVLVNCPVQECSWWNKYETQKKAEYALLLHCLGEHNLPEGLIRRFYRAWLVQARSYRAWTRALDEIDKLTGFKRRDSGLRVRSQRLMEAYLGIRA